MSFVILTVRPETLGNCGSFVDAQISDLSLLLSFLAVEHLYSPLGRRGIRSGQWTQTLTDANAEVKRDNKLMPVTLYIVRPPTDL